MEISYDDISKWFEAYFEDVRRCQGDIKTVPNLKNYFTADLLLTMYTAPSAPLRMSRDALLLSFVHPGLQEDIAPQRYVIDARQMAVAVQFEITFIDKLSGNKWPPLQASAHYQLTVEADTIKIRKIDYWTQKLPADLLEFWDKRRNEGLTIFALNYFR